MNSEPIDITKHRLDKASSNINLFVEMQDLGIDPMPLLKIAAHDLLNQFGNDAVIYCAQIERNFEDDGDIQSAEIWQTISHYLQNLNGSGELVAH